MFLLLKLMFVKLQFVVLMLHLMVVLMLQLMFLILLFIFLFDAVATIGGSEASSVSLTSLAAELSNLLQENNHTQLPLQCTISVCTLE